MRSSSLDYLSVPEHYQTHWTVTFFKLVQILGEPQKFFSSPSVWEHISSVQGELTPYPPSIPADVNCNFPFANRNVTSHWRKVKHSHTPVTPLNELLLDDNVGAVVVTDDYADVKKRKADNEQRSQIATKSLFDANLPPELKLKIFSYLNQREKGQCMFVSTEWNAMIRSPELWQHVNLREFRLCHGHVDDDLASSAYCGQEAAMDTSSFSQCTQQCYGQYINRVDNYISFLIDIQPKVKRLEFSFDLIEDNWIATVNRLKFHLKLNELQYADINWRDTPAKPNYLSSPNQGLNDVMYKTRRRCRKFLDFMEEFVEEAPNLQTLVVPFEWSSRSMKALLSLKKLRNLTIEKYFVFQRPVQEVLNSFGQMQCLERLVLEIWTPSSADMTKYSIISPSLRYLDLSQSRGFYLQSVDLPLLEVFIDERKPWNGPLTFPSQINLPCIGNILQAGAPKLSRVNTSNITTMKSETVEAILKTICPCRHHKSSVTM